MSGKPHSLILLAIAFSVVQTSESVAQVRRSNNSHSNTSMGRKVGFVPKHIQAQRLNTQPTVSKTDSEVTPVSHITGDSQFSEFGCGDSGCVGGCGGGCSGGDCSSDCGVSCGDGCSYGWAGPVMYGRLEYLLWSTKKMDSPPLVTTGVPGTIQEQAGVLGQPGTSILFGGSGMNDDVRSGGRVILGLWTDANRQVGIEFTQTILEEESQFFTASNFDESIVARPFFNLTLDDEDSRLIAFPSLVNGNVDVAATTEFQTFDITRRKAYWCNCTTQVDHFIGYRYAELKEAVRVFESTISLADPTTDTGFQLFDQFKTQSEFFGAVSGLRIRRQPSPCWSVELLGKIGLGNTRSRLSVDGETTTTDPDGASTTRSGGLLTQDSNIGELEDNEFSSFSEFGISLHRRLNCGVTCSLGYSFIYWSDVIRAGNSIDSVVNPTQIPPSELVGDARPAAAIAYESFFAQGLRLGLEFGY